jgi:hypothetical protein
MDPSAAETRRKLTVNNIRSRSSTVVSGLLASTPASYQNRKINQLFYRRLGFSLTSPFGAPHPCVWSSLQPAMKCPPVCHGSTDAERATIPFNSICNSRFAISILQNCPRWPLCILPGLATNSWTQPVSQARKITAIVLSSRGRIWSRPIEARKQFQRLALITTPRTANPNLHAHGDVFTCLEPAYETSRDDIVTLATNEVLELASNPRPSESPLLFQFTLDVDYARELLRLLERLDVDAASLFPGFAGAAQAGQGFLDINEIGYRREYTAINEHGLDNPELDPPTGNALLRGAYAVGLLANIDSQPLEGADLPKYQCSPNSRDRAIRAKPTWL